MSGFIIMKCALAICLNYRCVHIGAEPGYKYASNQSTRREEGIFVPWLCTYVNAPIIQTDGQSYLSDLQSEDVNAL